MTGPGAALVSSNVTSNTATTPPTLCFEVVQRICMRPNSWASAVTALAVTRGPGLTDPVLRAVPVVATAIDNGLDAIASASAAWWADFWDRSSISLPSQPAVEAFWYGAQYILAATAPTEASVDKAAPGLYGVWVTQDGPNWHGDYTLDYNYAAPFYGAFSSNHGEQVESYWGPIVSWLPAARIKAQVQAALAHVACPANAAYFGCHIAPWGLASIDPMTRYMSWNGPHAVLAFVNHFEFTRNASFAQNVVLPLLDAMNAWWACYLNRSATTGLWSDINIFNPDLEHEGQPVPNPQIALAFVRRTVHAQLDIAEALGLSPPAVLADIDVHLAPFNEVVVNVGPTERNGTWDVLADTRCSGDIQTFYGVPDAPSCEAHCLSNADCFVFSFCPPVVINNFSGCSGTNGQPQPLTCWAYTNSSLSDCVTDHAKNRGWTSGHFRSAPSPPSNATAHVWTAFEGADIAASDWFALYPSWPTEGVDPLSPFNADTGLAGLSQASSYTYSDFASGRPVDLFAAAARGGFNATAAPMAFSPSQVLAGLNAYLARFFGPSLLPYAPGGGIENAGVSRGVNEMLLQSFRVPAAGRASLGDYLLALFPFWPASEPASFSTLLAKGGFLMSAAFDNSTAAVRSPIAVRARFTLRDAAVARCSLLSPWEEGAGVAVRCGGASAPVATSRVGARVVLSFDAPRGAECLVARA